MIGKFIAPACPYALEKTCADIVARMHRTRQASLAAIEAIGGYRLSAECLGSIAAGVNNTVAASLEARDG
jgi:hypothetical protein